eukprot:s1971_g21.t1
MQCAASIGNIELQEKKDLGRFVPPSYHLLMRFAISSRSTIVRILTDRFQLLSYLDSFFQSWSSEPRVVWPVVRAKPL